MTPFTPRYDDCQPGGQMHPAAYLRAMLQAALEAGAANDPALRQKDAPGWLQRVGDLGVKIEQPVMFGDAIEVVMQLGWQQSDAWRHEFLFQRSGVSLARGFVDCFVEQAEPVEPDAAEDAEPLDDAAPEPAADEAPAWDGPAAEPPEAPGRAFGGRWHVAWQHLDISGQVDPAALTTMIGDMETRAAESLGWTPRREYDSGIVWQVCEHRLELFDTIEDEDELTVESYIGEVTDDELVRHTSMWREDNGVQNEVARARTRRVCIDPATDERRVIPDDWLEDMVDQLAEW
jgi:acyl-CoA thioesterase FadM